MSGAKPYLAFTFAAGKLLYVHMPSSANAAGAASTAITARVTKRMGSSGFEVELRCPLMPRVPFLVKAYGRFEYGGAVRRLLLGLAALTLLLAAFWARVDNRHNVFNHGAVELEPTDSHYYARFAERQRQAFPHFEPFDPYVNYPTGARIIWPVLHTWAVAAAESLAPEPEAGVAWVGPVLSMLELAFALVVSWRLKGPAFALGVAALWALVPLSVAQGILGCANHHLHEPFEVFLACLFASQAIEREDLGFAVLAGAALGFSRLLTPGAFVPVPLIALSVALAGRRRPGSRGTMTQVAALIGLGGILTSLPWVPLFGVGGVAYEELSYFQPVLMLGLFLGAGGVARLGKRGWVLIAAGGVVLATLAPQLSRAFEAFGRADPLLKLVEESQPLFRHPDWLSSQYGALPLLLLPALAGLVLLVREDKLEALPWLVAVLGLAAGAMVQSRFGRPLLGALFGALALGLPRCFAALPRVPRLAAWGLSGLLVLPFLSVLRTPPPRKLQVQTIIHPTLEWMHHHLEHPDPIHPQWGVIAQADLGHLIMLWAQLPAVATPFSQAPAHLEGNLRASKVLAAPDDESAYQAAKATGGRYLLLTPLENILGYPGVDAAATWCHHLWEAGGVEAEGRAASGHFRLVYSARERLEGKPYTRVFEVVPGALLRGKAEPGSKVSAGVWARVDGPDLPYRVDGTAGEDGYALRVAHPGKYFVHRDQSSVEVLVTEENIRLGSELHEPAREP